MGNGKGCEDRCGDCYDVREAWSEGYAAREAEIVEDLRAAAASYDQRIEAMEGGILGVVSHRLAKKLAYQAADRYESRADVKETK
jgi:hypothetical protein